MNKNDFIIFPAIDLRNGKCVRLIQGDYNRETIYSDKPAEQAKKWQEQGAVFIHLVDLDGAKNGKPINLAAVTSICQAVNIGCELGGGIRTIDDAEEVLKTGVTRIILGTVACENPDLVRQLIVKFGKEKIVVGIDAKKGIAAARGWLQDTGLNALDLGVKFAEMGVGRFIYTDIATDGMLKGPNLDAIAEFADKVPDAKVIASGGVSSKENVLALKKLNRNNLEGAIVGKALYDGNVKLPDLLS